MQNHIKYLTLIFTVLISFSVSLKENVSIRLTSKKVSNSIEELNENVNSTYMKKVILDLENIMDAYVYSDISQSPPNSDYFLKVNIKQELSNIETSKDRPFYDFYRDIRIALNKLRDFRLDIIGKDISFGKDVIQFSKYALCLPFKLYMDYNQEKQVKIFIDEYPECSTYYDDDILDFIRSHKNISLEKIGGKDAFEYIQNFGNELYEVKNPHAHFSFYIRNFHFFYLNRIPLSQTEIDSNITFSFADKPLTLKYHLIKPENIFDEYYKSIINKEEFDFYFSQEISKFENKNIFEIKDDFLKMKNLYKKIDSEDKNKEIIWNYETQKGEFKCRVDEENKLNVFYQTSFNFNNITNGEFVINKCVKMFYSNNYRIVGIESNNLGGNSLLSYLLTQLIQPKIDVKFHMSVRNNEIIKEHFDKNKNYYLDETTCFPFKSWDDFLESDPDVYSDDDINHYRSKIYSFVPRVVINNAKKLRLELEKEGKLKKPTDILIFTDSISNGETSIFIKNLQNTGGAIIAGYLGNPKNAEIFDASQGPSICNDFSWSNYNADLSKNGFEIKCIATEESFEGNYEKEKNKLIPREYKINEVDERTNIYKYFNDSSYEDFIKEAKNIFDKYNDNNKCNKDNLNLFLESSECSFPDDNHAHGGYTCGENGYWSTTCKKKYCDIGYYLNENTDKCEIDPCTTDIYFDINEEMEKEIEISPDNTYVFNLNNNSLAYFIESPIDDIIHYPTFETCTKFCAVKYSSFKYMYVNYFKNLKENIKIKVKAVVTTAQIISVKLDSPKQSKIQPVNKKMISLVQVNEKNYFYSDSYDNYAKIYFGEYVEGIEITDIINANTDYFPESHDKIFELNPDKIYVFIINAKASFVKLYLFNEIPETMKLANGNNNLLYLKQGKEYEFDFSENVLSFMIKLNPTKSSNLEITNDSGRKETLNNLNKFYNPMNQVNNVYKGKIKINNIQDDALIEIIYSFNETEVLSDREVTDKIISKQITLIEYNSLENENMEIYIKSDDYFKLTVYGGTSKNNYFYYSSSNLPQNSETSVKKYFIKLNSPIKNINLESAEKYKVSLMFSKTKEDQKITITYYYNKSPIDDLYEVLDKEYINNVVSNLISIISAYAYTEIAQNPPQPEGLPNYNHDPVDLVGSLNNIKREGRKFYEFYRELREILGTVRDLHFRIFGLNTPSGIKLDQITACLPFSFYVDKDSNNDIKMYIKYNDDCAAFYSEEERSYIKERCDNKIALKYINNENPFDYIQKWGRIYRGNKSPHAHFTLMKTLIHSFYIRLYPYTPEELSMTFEFETSSIESDKIDLDYFIFVPNVQNMKLYQNFNNFDKKEFDIFFENELKKNKDNVLEPNIFEMIKKFKILKGIIKETPKPKSTIIEWKYQTPEENGIKCLVDEENKVNVFVQGSFSIDDEKGQEVMYNCTRDFYQNDYRIIGIQDRDGGGWAHLCLIFHQLVQIKTQDRAFKASKLTDFFKKHVLDDYEGYVDVNTCKPFNNIDELFTGIVDDFSTKDKKLLHYRSQVFNYIDKDTRKRLQNNRKEFESYGHLKKPTDIIIYTDSFSYSATSSFIKGFQYTGGAIVVGYNGNPFIGKEQFDGSQSPASVTAFEFSEEYKNLDKLGIVVSGITFAETYDDYYIQDNPIPREYLLDPVDEVVDIYEPYTDDKYQIFINKAQEIFKKYNDDGYCNIKNKKLLLDANNGIDCYKFEDDEFAHGGYLCGDDGKWTNICKKYYCDIGYYYNQYKGKCERDICANDEGEKDIYLNGEYNENIVINNDNNMEYIYHINNTDYIYFFESDRGNGYIHYGYNKSCPNLCVVQFGSKMHDNKVYLNYYRNATEQNIVIKITSVKNFKGKINSLKAVDQQINSIDPIKISTSIYILESFYDYILYTNSIDNSISLLCAKYDKEMSKDDILDVNKKYFKECGDRINELTSNTIYIFAILSESYNKPVKLLFQPKKLSQNIEISQKQINFLYLSNDVDYYLLDFSENEIQRNIELSRLTLDSELIIKELETEEEVRINSDNLYYTFNEIDKVFKGKIAIKVISNNNALIEFIFKYSENDAEILVDRQYINYKLSKKMAIIKFDKNNKDKDVTLSIFSNNEKEFKLCMVLGYTKGEYYHYSKDNLPENLNLSLINYDLTVYNRDYSLEKDESLYLALIFDEKEISDDFYYISLTKLDKYSIDDFNVEISEEKCKIVVNNIIKLMEDGYIYTDIIKNPPNPEYFGKVDLISDLKNVETKNRKYYDFFRDIRRIIGKMKDGHLNIVAANSTNGYDLKKMTMCLPFSFIIKGETLEDAKMYIEKYEDCFKYFNIKTQKFIERHLDIPLQSINNTDPFDFIQNIQLEFNAIHNKHGQFSRNMNAAHKISINRNPLTKEQFSNIEFVFENKELIKLDYYLYYADPKVNKDKEFINFYNHEILKEKRTLDEISILDIEKKFYKIKNNIKEIKGNNELEWNFTTKNPDGIQCRVDNINQVNVFKQKTFNFIEEEYDEALIVINNCTEAFYNNEYPIIGIESNNGGGIIEVSLYLQQFLQVKILQRTHFSTKVTDLIKKEIESFLDELIDVDTGKGFKSFEDMKEKIDDYGNDIKHHRTKPFLLYNSSELKEHDKRRKDYFKKNLKKPTEIIIFTDSFSYSSTSFFIKGLQETGAAILVGYKGNPKSNEIFEASHSPSAVDTFEDTDIYNNLTDCGFEIIGTTFFESFNYSYKYDNPTPREYLVHPVDERVNIFENYDDSLYDKFISEAKKIFKKYNVDEFCNKNNLLLIYEPDNKKDCYSFKNDAHAHGGYECDAETGKWTKKCVPYYCDIGYYFDVHNKKCVEDILTQDKSTKFATWAIVLISIIVVILLVICVIIIFKFLLKKKDRESKVKGPLIDKNDSNMEVDKKDEEVEVDKKDEEN